MDFHPKVPLDLSKDTRGEILGILGESGQCGRWPPQACKKMFFLQIPKSVTSERPIALLPTMIRWWEGMRAPEVTRWQQASPCRPTSRIHVLRCETSGTRNFEEAHHMHLRHHCACMQADNVFGSNTGNAAVASELHQPCWQR